MANTTADKLNKLASTKADLKAALAEKGQTVGDVFSTYPAAVRAIETGEGNAIFSNNANSNSSVYGNIYYTDGAIEEDISIVAGESKILPIGSVVSMKQFGTFQNFSGDCNVVYSGSGTHILQIYGDCEAYAYGGGGAG